MPLLDPTLFPQCEMDSGDPTDPDKITSSNFASVCVKMVPNPPPAGAGPAKSAGKVDLPDNGEGSVVETVKTRSTKTLYSIEVGTKAQTQKSTGGSTSKRSSSVKTSLTNLGAPDGAAAAPSEPPVERVLSQLYTNKDCSWGFEKLFDLGKMFDFRTGYITEYGEDEKKKHYPVDNLQNGAMTMTIEILAASGIRLDQPRADSDLTPEGRSRVYWPVHNLKRLVEKIGPGKRLSSAEFTCGDDAWYLDLYPNGFHAKTPNTLSLFLHVSRKSADLGHVVKRRFRFGIKKNQAKEDEPAAAAAAGAPGVAAGRPARPKKPEDPVYFPKGSACMATFTPAARCFGKAELISLADIIQHKLILGSYEGKGGLILVLDYLVDDTETWSAPTRARAPAHRRTRPH
jgi:hypothetical protein